MSNTEPVAVRLQDIETEISEEGLFGTFISTDAWSLGLFFMEPGVETKIFSLEQEKDESIDIDGWYGPVREFNYILTGEFTLWWGKDAEQLLKKEGPKLSVQAGEVLSYPPGWKYLIKNTGKVPGVYFWGLSAPQKETKSSE